MNSYDAFVIGSAVYFDSWRKEATEFVTQRRSLATRPVWLFSSGPSSANIIDKDGNDLRAQAEPKQIPEITA
ncbi:MAG: flavodoxin domain-containing protein [Thermomicrobiales bacterium]